MKRSKDGDKSGTKWQLSTRFCATLLSDLQRGSHAGRRFPSRKEFTCTYCLYCFHTLGIETNETKGTRDGSGNLHHFRSSTTCLRTEVAPGDQNIPVAAPPRQLE